MKVYTLKTVKLERNWKRKKMEIHSAHGLEELILFKCSYTPDSQSNSYQKFNDIFHRNRKKS
jgi:hypothetical protein